jgi:Asp-tRNA(Asn)/Glu-tRNA(Gln) amidotransferase A subunit family amidase
MRSFGQRGVDRRTFLAAGLAMAMRPSLQAPRLETLTDWLKAPRHGREAGLAGCLELIRDQDPSIQAWVRVDPQTPTADGPLAGIPFGAKDIIDTEGLATEYGSALYKGRTSTADASIVRDLRARGAVLLGKTQSAAFAYRQPAPTRNPRNLAHTPGGSSSGSAAAVAAGMVPFALGTQTMGSVLRPASYCGITGFKASYGLLSLEGVLPFAKSLDTLGFFTHGAADMLALWVSMGHPAGADEDVAFGVPDPVPPVEPDMAAAFDRAVLALGRAGALIQTIDIAAMLGTLAEAAWVIQAYEGARFHEARYRQYGDRLDMLAGLVREGLEIPVTRYDESRRQVDECRVRVAAIYDRTPVILVPAATGTAPLGLALTGDARMNAPWTALGTPAITIPMPVTDGLPLGLQLTGARGEDPRVIRAGVRVERALADEWGRVPG